MEANEACQGDVYYIAKYQKAVYYKVDIRLQNGNTIFSFSDS